MARIIARSFELGLFGNGDGEIKVEYGPFERFDLIAEAVCAGISGSAGPQAGNPLPDRRGTLLHNLGGNRILRKMPEKRAHECNISKAGAIAKHEWLVR